MRKHLYLFVLAFTFLFALAACGSSAGENEKGQNNTSGNQGESDENGQSYTVQHAMGETPIDGTPENVVILTNEGTEALLAMGVKPVGAVKSWLGDPWYDHIADEMEGVEVVGTESQVNLEAIAELQPDLIIGNKMRQEEIYDKLNAIAPTVFAETLRGNWKINFELYAEALNREEEGEQVLNDFDERIQSIRDRLGDEVNQEISLVRFMPADIRILHKDTFAGVILDQIGFNRPPNQDKDDFAQRHVSKEMIPKMDGDMIFYYTYAPEEDGDESQKAQEEWTSSQLWQNLDAVQAGNAHHVSDAIWNTAGGVIAANRMLDDIEDIYELEDAE